MDETYEDWTCEECDGLKLVECWGCDGTGKYIDEHDSPYAGEQCDECEGSGMVPCFGCD